MKRKDSRWDEARWIAWSNGRHCAEVSGNGNPYRKGSVMAAEWQRGFDYHKAQG